MRALWVLVLILAVSAQSSLASAQIKGKFARQLLQGSPLTSDSTAPEPDVKQGIASGVDVAGIPAAAASTTRVPVQGRPVGSPSSAYAQQTAPTQQQRNAQRQDAFAQQEAAFAQQQAQAAAAQAKNAKPAAAAVGPEAPTTDPATTTAAIGAPGEGRAAAEPSASDLPGIVTADSAAAASNLNQALAPAADAAAAASVAESPAPAPKTQPGGRPLPPVAEAEATAEPPAPTPPPAPSVEELAAQVPKPKPRQTPSPMPRPPTPPPPNPPRASPSPQASARSAAAAAAASVAESPAPTPKTRPGEIPLPPGAEAETTAVLEDTTPPPAPSVEELAAKAAKARQTPSPMPSSPSPKPGPPPPMPPPPYPPGMTRKTDLTNQIPANKTVLQNVIVQIPANASKAFQFDWVCDAKGKLFLAVNQDHMITCGSGKIDLEQTLKIKGAKLIKCPNVTEACPGNKAVQFTATFANSAKEFKAAQKEFIEGIANAAAVSPQQVVITNIKMLYKPSIEELEDITDYPPEPKPEPALGNATAAAGPAATGANTTATGANATAAQAANGNATATPNDALALPGSLPVGQEGPTAWGAAAAIPDNNTNAANATATAKSAAKPVDKPAGKRNATAGLVAEEAGAKPGDKPTGPAAPGPTMPGDEPTGPATPGPTTAAGAPLRHLLHALLQADAPNPDGGKPGTATPDVAATSVGPKSEEQSVVAAGKPDVESAAQPAASAEQTTQTPTAEKPVDNPATPESVGDGVDATAAKPADSGTAAAGDAKDKEAGEAEAMVEEAPSQQRIEVTTSIQPLTPYEAQSVLDTTDSAYFKETLNKTLKATNLALKGGISAKIGESLKEYKWPRALSRPKKENTTVEEEPPEEVEDPPLLPQPGADVEKPDEAKADNATEATPAPSPAPQKSSATSSTTNAFTTLALLVIGAAVAL